MDAETPSPENLELIRAHYAAFARGDVEAVLAGLHPGVTITVHDEHGKPEEGPFEGPEGARAFFGAIRDQVTGRTVEIESLRADEDKVLARVRLGGTRRSTGESGEIQAVHLFTLIEGSISEIRTYRPDWRG
jgi:ketosteroid isomerase-like protein